MQMTFDKFRSSLPAGRVGKVFVATDEADCTQCREAVLPGDVALRVCDDVLCQSCAMGVER